MDIAISIIIPIYNAEKYIKKTIDSILGQTLTNIELILVDDGSADNSGRIADEYMEKDSRVKVIHQGNCGVDESRNAGLLAAQGEYVGFVDSDDWADKEMFQSLYSAAIYHKCDIAMCGCKRENDRGTTETILLPIENGIYEKDEIKRLVLIPMVAPDLVYDNWKSIINSVWKNIYKRDMLFKNNISFRSQRLIYAEDLMFNLEAFYCAERLCVVNVPFYHYYKDNPFSLTKMYQPDFNNMILALNDLIEDFIKKHDLGFYSKEPMKTRVLISTEMMVANVFRPGNSSSIFEKVKQIKDILEVPKNREAMKKISLKDLPLKKRISYFCFRHRLSFLIYLHYWYSIQSYRKVKHGH